MKELYEFKESFVINNLVNHVVEDYGVKRKQAKTLLLNALVYNVVISEIKNHIEYLLED